MKAVPDTRLVSELCVPGSHHSGSIKKAKKVKGAVAALQTQERNHRWTKQLYDGIRSFDLHTYLDNGEIVGLHGSVDQEWTYEGFQVCVERFLSDHPTETVFAFIKINEKAGRDFDAHKVYTRSYAEKWWQTITKIYNQSPRIYAVHNHKTFAQCTLGELRGKIVLIARDHSEIGPIPALPWVWTDVPSHIPESTESGVSEAWDQTGPQVKWNKVKAVLEVAMADSDPNNFYSGSLDANDFPQTVPRRQTAFELNCFLDDLLNKLPPHVRLGFLNLDFYNTPSNLVADFVSRNPF